MIMKFGAEYSYIPKRFRKGWRVLVQDNKTKARFLFDSAWYTQQEAESLAHSQRLKDGAVC